MFEHKKQPLASSKRFTRRLLYSFALAIFLCGVSLAAGMGGYHYLEGLSWMDSFLNAAMILGGMGPVDAMKTQGGKLFAGCYALYSGLFMVMSMGILLAPLFHRMMHHFHMERG